MHGVDVLIVSAGTSRDHEQFAVLRHQRALQGASRPLARLERIGVAGHQRKIVGAAVQREAQISHHHLRAVSAVQARSERNRIALLIDYTNVAGVARMIALAGDVVIVRPLDGTEIRLELFRIACPQFQRRFLRIDELAALGAV